MSRRYGRNQKRAARAREATLAETLRTSEIGARHWEKSYQLARYDLQHLDGILCDVVRFIGEHHPTLAPETRKMFNVAHAPFFFAAPPLTRTIDSFNNFNTDASYEVMKMLVATVYRGPDDLFNRQQHYRVEFDGEVCAYAISEEAAREIPPKILSKRMAVEFATRIEELLMTKYSGSRRDGPGARRSRNLPPRHPLKAR